jgi:hypothetical protein
MYTLLETGKYYQIPFFDKVQYIGKSDNDTLFMFIWKNFIGKKIVIRRSFIALNGENTPILLQNVEDNDTDSEFPDDSYE